MKFARLFVVIFVAFPILYAGSELLEAFFRDRPKASQFPGRLLAETVTRAWRQRFGTPLVYVGGAEVGTGPGEFAANNVAVYSADRPHVLVHGEPRLSPWIEPADLKRRGLVLLWEQAPGDAKLPANIAANFPNAEVQPLLTLARQTPRPVRPATIGVAFVPPMP